MTSAWEPSTVPVPPDRPAPAESPWDPSRTVARAPEAPPNGADQWEYVDPNANPSLYATQPAPAAPPQAAWVPNGTAPQAPLPPPQPNGADPWAYADPGANADPYPAHPGQQIAPPTAWDPNAGATQAAWVPSGQHTQVTEPTPVPPPADQWVYVDPSAYSNPYAEQPVYTSGPQVVPTGPPVEPAPQYAPDPATVYPPGPASNGTGQPHAAPAPVYGAAASTTAPPGYAPLPVAGYGPAPQPGYESAASAGYGAAPTAGSDPAQAQPADPLLASSYQPEEGELKIKERRSWKTWQLLIAVALAVGFGMWLNGNAGTASGDPAASGSGASGGYKLPPDGASATTVPASAAAAGAGSTATTAAGSTSTTAAGSTSTTTAGGSTATTAAPTVGPATVLIPQTTQTGNWTSPAFTIAGGTWNIGWAFQCAPAPTGGPSFQIFVVNSGAAPGSTPAVTSTAASGQSVSPETTAGSQQVIVQTTAACRWAVKVTGSSP